jgi:hypothetical protein
MEKPKLNAKSTDGKHEWNRETLQALHASGMPDSGIADLFGTSDAFVSFGRKRESFWEGLAIAEPSQDLPKAEKQVKKKEVETVEKVEKE